MANARDEELAERLKRFNAQISGEVDEIVDAKLEAVRAKVRTVDDAIDYESIVLRRARPVLAIRENNTDLTFEDPADIKAWRQRLLDAKPLLDAAIPAVGRINVQGHELSWLGTGWLVADDIVVTNRHVAREFATRNGKGFEFAPGTDGPMSAELDFFQEIGRDETAAFSIEEILHVEGTGGPDLAFLRVVPLDGRAKPIKLAAAPAENPAVATIGYPAFDSRIPEYDTMARIYRGTYDKKRLAPGAVTQVDARRIFHNCTTLGGNSGSAVIDLKTGEAVGLHFSGTFLVTNYAVRSDVVASRLADLRAGRLSVSERPSSPPPIRTPPPPDGDTQRPTHPATRTADGTTTFTVPLTITVSLGDAASARPARPRLPPRSGSRQQDVEPENEARPADYDDRPGYAADFLGKRRIVPLPVVQRDADDVLRFQDRGVEEHQLRYQHYSVVMSRARRMCFFSAVNIDGSKSRKDKRAGWKWDPRIPHAQQIFHECYGSTPKFSRGHMTRREDPGWGDAAESRRGNEDSMHVTNATPQMQSFNAPIWLGLEDYALGHARVDGMRISVFTGPYFDEQDPVMYGVQIPVAFWKVIAFLHDDTNQLVATGYEMSQEENLIQPEFVYGQYVSPQLNLATQVPISAIEIRSGIDLGPLSAADPYADNELARARPPLVSFEQIRFS